MPIAHIRPSYSIKIALKCVYVHKRRLFLKHVIHHFSLARNVNTLYPLHNTTQTFIKYNFYICSSFLWLLIVCVRNEHYGVEARDNSGTQFVQR